VSGAIVTIDSTGTDVTGKVLMGFAANRVSTAAINSDYTFNQPWTVNFPYYNDGNFNTATGVYTVAVSGIYAIKAMISYTTYKDHDSLIAWPGFAIVRNGTNVIWGDMTDFILIGIWVDGTATLASQLKLIAGDEITLRYVANGSPAICNFGPSEERPVIWTIQQML
jgi:hypothetical protein